MGILNHNEISGLAKFKNLYFDGISYEENDHNFSNDLDIYGPYSIFHLLNRTKTFFGSNFLADWLGETPLISEVHERQKAVVELEKEVDFRQEVNALIFDQKGDHTVDISGRINSLLDTDLSFASSRPLVYYSRLLPIIWVLVALIYYYNDAIGYVLLVFTGMLNFGISMFFAQKVSLIQKQNF